MSSARPRIASSREPLIAPSTLRRLIATSVSADAPLALVSARVREPAGYGRLIRRADGSIARTVEEVDATDEERRVDEVWGGSMLVWADWLWPALERLPVSAKGEFYLPELVNLASGEGRTVRAVLAEHEDEVYGINDRLQLAQANAILRQRTLVVLMRAGVTIVDPSTTFLEPEVEIAADAIIQPGCHLQGATRIGEGAEIGPNSLVRDSEIGARSRVWMSVV